VGDEVEQDQAELVRGPACGREVPVAKVVVAAARQPGASEHPGDGAQARLRQEPGDHGAEGRKRRGGKAGAEHDEQVGERAR
jgi:hypothetical protein